MIAKANAAGLYVLPPPTASPRKEPVPEKRISIIQYSDRKRNEHLAVLITDLDEPVLIAKDASDEIHFLLLSEDMRTLKPCGYPPSLIGHFPIEKWKVVTSKKPEKEFVDDAFELATFWETRYSEMKEKARKLLAPPAPAKKNSPRRSRIRTPRK